MSRNRSRAEQRAEGVGGEGEGGTTAIATAATYAGAFINVLWHFLIPAQHQLTFLSPFSPLLRPLLLSLSLIFINQCN